MINIKSTADVSVVLFILIMMFIVYSNNTDKYKAFIIFYELLFSHHYDVLIRFIKSPLILEEGEILSKGAT